MRKLLLASAAVLGITGAIDSSAYAQLSVQYGDNSGDDAGAGGPAPGQITVRLNGRFQFFIGGYTNSDMNDSYYYDSVTGHASAAPFVVSGPGNTFITTTASGTTGQPTVPTYLSPSGAALTSSGALVTPTNTSGAIAIATNSVRAAALLREKVQNYGIVDLARLYPGFDGVAANGLKYGASFEIRSSDFGGAGGAVYSSPSQVSRVRNTLQFRRAWGYVGTDQLGTLRFGQVDGPSSLFLVGNFENFNSGGWNGAIPASLSSQFDSPWPFPDVGAEYATNKLVYLSPQIFGFDLGVSYEPDSSGLNGDNQNGCESEAFSSNQIGPGPGSVAGPGCDLLSSTDSGDLRRRRNTIETALRYRGTFGPVGVAAFADYTFSGKVNYSGGNGTGVVPQQYLPYSYGMGGAQVTFAGFTVGGMARGGNENTIDNNEALQPAGTKPTTSVLVGASYTVGPVVAGAHGFETWQPGNQSSATAASGAVGRYRARGIAAGATYSIAPGLAAYLEYLWGDIRQNGYDLDLGTAGPNHNYIHTQYLGVGTGLSW